MKFKTEEMKIKDFIEFVKAGNLELNPPYQRNPIWTKKAKQDLIDTINIGYPLPNFFIYKKSGSEYEMVDGQQRSRTILGFYDNLLENSNKETMSQLNATEKKVFLNYNLIITIIEDISEEDESKESVEDFYYKVNTKGLRLNIPEVRKAKYYHTVLYGLVVDLLSLDAFSELNIFTPRAQDRMNDADFIAELLILLKFGNTDKKLKIEETFKKDITTEEAEKLSVEFVQIISHFVRFNKIEPINKTRYKQRNDFFTLFGIIKNNKDIDAKVLDYFYKVLVWIQYDISPSSECKPFFDYATNCVSQSNSKKARDERLKFLNELLLNTSGKINETQKMIMKYYVKYYDLNFDNLALTISGYTTLNVN